MDYNTLVCTLREKLDHEMNEFKASYNDMSNTEIYNDWYIIGFHESFYEMLSCDFVESNIDEDIIDWLIKKETPISYLYQEWLSCDGEMSYSWDDMVKWLEGVYSEEKHLERQELYNNINSLGLKDVSEKNDEYFSEFDYFVHISNEPFVFSANFPNNFDKDVDKEFAAFFNEKLLVKSCDYGCDTYPNGVTKDIEGLGEYTFQQQVWNFIDSVEQMFDCKCHFYEGYNGFEFAFEFGSDDNKGCYVLAAGNNGQEYSETLYFTNPEIIRDPQIANVIISIDKALYTLLEEHNLKMKVSENVLSNDDSLDSKADFLISFFDAQLINMSIDVKDGHLLAKDDEANKWKDAEIYDFALNECLCFEKDGSLASGLAAAEPYVERLKADAKAFGVEITSFVVEDKPALDETIKQAKGQVVEQKGTKVLNAEQER